MANIGFMVHRDRPRLYNGLDAKLRGLGHRVEILTRARGPRRPLDLIVGWGASVPYAARRVLNREHVAPKFIELERLQAAGVPVPRFTTGLPGLGTWHPRSNNHQGGRDFNEGYFDRRVPDFYTEHVDTYKEFRVHVFGDEIGPIAKKFHRNGIQAHPFIRSWDWGWGMTYQRSDQCTQTARGAAKAAVRGLGYQFGAVDVALRRHGGGSVVVWEVNTAPGLEVPCVLDAYVAYIVGQLPR